MIQLKDLGTFESVPHIVTDIVTGNISALENALANGWDINIPIEIGEYSEHTPFELVILVIFSFIFLSMISALQHQAANLHFFCRSI